MLVKILRRASKVVIILGILWLGAAKNCSGATYTYIGPNNGSWTSSGNWIGGSNYPGFAAGDVANFILGTNVNVNSTLPNAVSSINIGSLIAVSVTVSSGNTFAVSGTTTIGAGLISTFTVTGAGSATFGTISFGYQSTFTIGSAGVTTTNVTLNSGSTLSMTNNNNAFTNYGTFSASSCTLTLSGGPTTFTNLGTVTLTSSPLNMSNNNSTITNSGTFNINTSTITLSGGPNTFTNSGTVNLNSGSTLSVTNNNTWLNNTGTFTAMSATISFSSSAGTSGINNNSPGNFTATSTTLSFVAGSGNSINNTSTFYATLCPITLGGGPSTLYNTGGTFTGDGCTITLAQSSSIRNTGTCTLEASGATPSTVSFGYGAYISNTGAGSTFNAGTSNSQCVLNVSSQTAYITNSGTATTNFNLGSTSIINLSGIQASVTNTSPAVFTLQSDQYGSAAIGTLYGNLGSPGQNAVCTGTFSVQRYYQCGATKSGSRWVYRNYRIISSPVNTGSQVISGSGNYYISGLNYIVGATAGQTTAANSTTNSFVMGATGGSSSSGNPSLFLYRESITPSNVTYTSGNFIGITDITSATALHTSDGAVNTTIPAGNGVFFFYRGNATSFTTRTTNPYIAPENTILTATGTLNQQNVLVKNWYSTSSATLGYSGSGGGTNSAVRGFNMVGNPYASSIDWNTAYSGTGITRTNINPTIWMFNPFTNQYDTYMTTSASTGTSNGGGTDGSGYATKIIASGQGFFVQANAASPALTFTEAAKSATSQLTGSYLLMGAPPVQSVAQLLRLRMVKDSIEHDDITIVFNSNASANYNGNEDAEYLAGMNAAEGLASLSNDSNPIPLSINTLPLPKQTAQTIRLNVTAAKSGTFTFQRTQLDAIPQIYQVWLMDKFKKDSLDLRNNTTYAFDVDLTDTATFGSNRFAIVIRENPALAMHLLNFTATKTTSAAQLGWKTENEQNYTNFTVQRSIDNGVTFDVLGGFVSSAQGTYSFTDQNPQMVSDQYRLKLEDLNGTITYSNVVTLMYDKLSDNLVINNLNIYPNPTNNVINLSIKPTINLISTLPAVQSINSTPGLVASAPATASYQIKIIDITGYVIKTVNSNLNSWQDNVSNLTPGTYVVQVVNNKDKSLVGKTIFVKY